MHILNINDQRHFKDKFEQLRKKLIEDKGLL